MLAKFFQIFVYSIAGAVVLWSIQPPVAAAPFISEIVLPVSGTTAVEIDGLDERPATLLILGANNARLDVRHRAVLPPADQTFAGRGTAVVAGPGWSDAAFSPPASPTTIHLDDALFKPGFAYYLALLDGESPIAESVAVGELTNLNDMLAPAPLVDWVGFSVASPFFAAPAPTGVPTAVAAALDEADIAGPIVSSVTRPVLARVNTAAGPEMEALVDGTTSVIDASPLGLEDFVFSPGRSNPLTTPIAISDVPEPGAGLMLGLIGWRLIRRSPRSKPSR